MNTSMNSGVLLSSSVDMLERLIGFATVSSESNLALIDYVRSYLAEQGIESRLTFNADRRKANLFATIGPPRAGGIVLSGHTDVVPVIGQPWDTDPFRLHRSGDRLHGRGTCDMKSFIAISLAAVPAFAAANLRRPIHLALSYDEELGCLGAPGMLRDIGEHLPPPALAIIGEPTSMRLANRQKGSLALRTILTGRDGHSSAPHRGVNAIAYANEFISFLQKMATEFHTAGPFDESFDPPYTTVNVGVVNGGAAANIIARRCEVVWDFRPLPGVSPEGVIERVKAFLQDELLRRMRCDAPEASVELIPLYEVPPLVPEKDSPAEALVRLLVDGPPAGGMSFGTEAGQFQRAGMSAVVFGPGSIEQAHRPNEYISMDQVQACSDFMGKICAWAASEACVDWVGGPL
jgi:acetylornithine deacetylase